MSASGSESEDDQPTMDDGELAAKLQEQFLNEYSNYHAGLSSLAGPPPPANVGSSAPAGFVGGGGESMQANHVAFAKSLIESLVQGFLSFFLNLLSVN